MEQYNSLNIQHQQLYSSFTNIEDELYCLKIKYGMTLLEVTELLPNEDDKIKFRNEFHNNMSMLSPEVYKKYFGKYKINNEKTY